MKGKILGIPLILIILALAIAALVDGPMYALHVGMMKELESVKKTNALIYKEQMKPTPTPTVIPSPTQIPSPTPRFKTVPTNAVPLSTQSSTIK